MACESHFFEHLGTKALHSLLIIGRLGKTEALPLKEDTLGAGLQEVRYQLGLNDEYGLVQEEKVEFG